MNVEVQRGITLRPGGSVEQPSAAAQGERTAHSSTYVWYVIFLLSTVNVFNYMDRMAFSVLMPSIKADLDLSDGQLGFLVGFAFFLFYAACGVPIARWADRGVRRDIIAMALTVWSAMMALSGAAQNFWQVFALRVGLAAGEAGATPASQSIVCDYVPPQQRPGVFAILQFGALAGMMFGMALAGTLAATVGWRWAFVVLGLPGIGVAALVRFTLREPTRGFFDKVRDDRSILRFRDVIRTLLQTPSYPLLVAFLVVNGFVQLGLQQWWPSHFSRAFGLDSSVVGVHLGVATGIGSAIGLLIGGLMANRIAQHDVRLSLRIGAMALCLALPAAFASLFVPSAFASTLFVMMTWILWSVPTPQVVAVLMSVIAPRMRATAAALTTFFISVFGFGLGPFCVGIVSDLLTPRFGVQGLRYALLVPICLFPVLIAILYRIANTLPSELRRANPQI